jgi:ubiquinone/menaquinone biosynthesis C-methylase UbiE
MEKAKILECRNCHRIFIGNGWQNKPKNADYGSSEIINILCDVCYDKDRTGSIDTYLNLRSFQEIIKECEKKLKSIKNKKILDIGFGNGVLLGILYKKGAMCFGIENRKSAVNSVSKLNSSFNLKLADATNIPFKENEFDAAVSSFVLEFILKDAEALKETARVTKQEGIIILTVPSERYNAKDKIHLREYSIEDMRSLAKKANLDLVEARYFRTFYDTFLEKFINFTPTKRMIMPLMLKLAFIDNFLARIFRGQNLLFILKKG